MSEQTTTEGGIHISRNIFRLYRSFKISAAELILLWKLDRTQKKNPKKSFQASNRQLSLWWGRSTRHVSRSLNHFHKQGYISLQEVKGGEEGTVREIRVHLKIEKGGQDKKDQSNTNSTHTTYVYGCANKNNKFNIDQESPIYRLCVKFKKFITARHSISINDYILQKWLLNATDLIQHQLKGDHSRFEKVLQWYQDNIENPFLTECQSMVTFCRKFHTIEKMMLREKREETSKLVVKRKKELPAEEPVQDFDEMQREEW